MKITEAQSIYRGYRQQLIDQKKCFVKQRDDAKKQYEITGVQEFDQQAAVFQRSIDAVQKEFEKNQKVLDELSEQYAGVWNAEAAKQQAEAEEEGLEELSKIMEVARRISKGHIVPYSDEKKLMEYSSELYQMAKSSAMLHRMEKHKKYDSLWEDEEEKAEQTDPKETADNAEATVDLPEINVEIGTGE